jgi:AcrR family transcriptional regulator
MPAAPEGADNTLQENALGAAHRSEGVTSAANRGPCATQRFIVAGSQEPELAWNVRFKHLFYMQLDTYGETGAKIMTAAESLFAEHGYDGVSLRRITAAAGANLAAVNYHYGDKQSLYVEIVTCRLRQLSQARVDRLTEAEARAGGAPISLEESINALAQPLLRPAESMTTFGPASRRVLGRALVEPLPFLTDTLAAEFQPAVARCGQAIRRHLPALPPADFVWRYSFVVGALHHAAATMHDMKTRTRGLCANHDGETALRNFREFAVGAFAAKHFQ